MTKVLDGPPNAVGRVTVQIDGETLNWMVEGIVIGPGGKPVQLANGEFRRRTVTFPYRILVNNAVAVTGVTSQPASLDQQGGPDVGADVILINKTDGRLRLGNIGIGGYDIEDGHCTLASKPKAP